jgi:hypothetical protein
MFEALPSDAPALARLKRWLEAYVYGAEIGQSGLYVVSHVKNGSVHKFDILPHRIPSLPNSTATRLKLLNETCCNCNISSKFQVC